MGLPVGIGMGLRVEDDLNDAFAIAQVDEDDPAVVAAAMHPAHQDYFFPCVVGLQLPAVMGSFCFRDEVGQGFLPPYKAEVERVRG